MSAEAVVTEIIEPMHGLFLVPRQTDEARQKALLKEYVSALERFDAPDLQDAWKTVRDSYRARTWPPIAAFVLAARQSRDARVGPPTKQMDADRRHWALDWREWMNARESAIAMKAVDMNCAWSFKCAILYDHKKLGEVDVYKLAAGKRSAERLAERIKSGDAGFKPDIADVALKHWETQLINEEETQNEIRRAHERGSPHGRELIPENHLL